MSVTAVSTSPRTTPKWFFDHVKRAMWSSTPTPEDLSSSHTMGRGPAGDMGAVGIEQQIAHDISVIFWCGDAPAGLLDVLAARSGGLPLFVGALVESFADTGALYRFDGRWLHSILRRYPRP